jgi:hypothetical protein
MAATTYTGTGASLAVANTVNGVNFQPDFVWVKGRSGATDHALYDSVRGTTKDLVSNATSAETTQATGLTAFGSTGFTVGALAKMNTSAATYVGWQWKGGGTAVSNTAGSITSSVSANTTAGFSVVTYTGTGANATVGHGLGVAPQMVIVKNRGGSYSWLVYHKFMAASSPATWYMSLNQTSAASNGANVWINDPTSTVFTVSGTYPEVNASSNTYVAYCFAPVAGYSAFGSYTGNGIADGPFVYTAMRPRWIMLKRTDTAGFPWWIFDTSRNTYNVADLGLHANTADSESSAGFPYSTLDLLSNGFKLRATAGGVNASGGTYIYMTFAENPTKFANAR